MEAEGTVVTWEAFRGKFFQKYFPTDLRRRKKMEFLRLEQGGMSVGEYAAKFEELARFCPYSELEMDGRSKCSKFEPGLKPKLRRMFGHQEIADFPTLVNKCRMYEDDLTVDVVVTPRANPPKNFGPQRNHPKAHLGGEILGYTGGFSPEREMSRLGEKWHFRTVETVRFSLEREGQI
ncbi:hypothetical protein Lal_00013484 [Lupinus albus]|nr:hypothetical protein Lal_00013484 [Lupinus albus]